MTISTIDRTRGETRKRIGWMFGTLVTANIAAWCWVFSLLHAQPLMLGTAWPIKQSDADFALAEGAMGLFDGVAKPEAYGNRASANIARRMGWPVVLVIDVSGQAQSAAATALGFSRYDPSVRIAGVILNRVASPRHERLARNGMDAVEIRVFGALPRRGDLKLPKRHLGLVQAVEHPDLNARITEYAPFLRAHVDIPALRDATTASTRPASAPSWIRPPAQRIALTQDAAFSFTYARVLEGWQRAGVEILPFSPLADEPPAADANLVWLPAAIPRRWARMAGLLGLVTSYTQRTMHVGYRRAALLAPMGSVATGAALTGHEFHYSTILDQPDAPPSRTSPTPRAIPSPKPARIAATSRAASST